MDLGPQRGKLIALLLLAPLCAWLAYRNLFSPGDATVSASPEARPPRRGTGSPPPRNAARQDPARTGVAADLDPTLRLDLLEKSRQVDYEGGSRNIFEPYTPPPPPPPPAPPATDPLPAVRTPTAPPASTIPLKFYGVAEHPDGRPKKAFLTDGEEIFIGQEGDLIARFYKITRIGVSTIELEDSRDRRRHQLPLLEE